MKQNMMKSQLTALSLLRTKLIFCFLFMIVSCSKSEKEIYYGQLENYFQKEHGFKINGKINGILVLTENGCLSCDKAFSKILNEAQNKDSILILVMATGSRVDISNFDVKSKNVFFAKDSKTDNSYKFLTETKAIFIKNNAIDSVFTIQADKIEDQFSEIKKRIY